MGVGPGGGRSRGSFGILEETCIVQCGGGWQGQGGAVTLECGAHLALLSSSVRCWVCVHSTALHVVHIPICEHVGTWALDLSGGIKVKNRTCVLSLSFLLSLLLCPYLPVKVS